VTEEPNKPQQDPSPEDEQAKGPAGDPPGPEASASQSDDAAAAPDAASDDDLGFSQDDIDALMRESSAELGSEQGAAQQTDAKKDTPEPSQAADEFESDLDSAVAEALSEVQDSGTEAVGAGAPSPESFDLPSFDSGASAGSAGQPISLLHDVQLHVKVELGRTRMFVEDVLQLGQGSVVELDKLAGDPVDVYVNDRLVARGEVLVLNDNFCVRVGEIIAPYEQQEKQAVQ